MECGPGTLKRMKRALSFSHFIRVLRARRWSAETADNTASAMRAPKFQGGSLHKFFSPVIGKSRTK
jgi:hypothetical protein